MALADVFDALITQRPYKPPMDYAHALDIIIKGRGTHFDPDLVDACVAQFDMFIKVAERNRDQVTDVSPNIQRMHTILRLRATS
jgi:putative two-component system response regulator